MSSYSSVQNHRSMVFDDTRNNVYARALEKVVTPESLVLDLGAGLGIHGFIAAKLGAKKVYMVDPSPVLQVAERIARANGYGEQIECIRKPIEQVTLPEKVDIIISVLTGNFLLTEDLLPLLFYARDRFLRKGGTLLPDGARMEVAAVSAPKYYEKHISCWGEHPQKISYEPVRDYAVNSLYYDSAESFSAEMLSESTDLTAFDFMTATDAACRNKIKVKINHGGLCHGWLGWFQARLGDEWMSTSPLVEPSHWRQVFMPIGKPLQVRRGDSLEFDLHRPEAGEWTWTTETDNTRQRHSTFLSLPLMPEKLLKQTDDYRATLSRQGSAVCHVLNRFDGSLANREIIEEISSTYSNLFPNHEQTKSFVKKLVETYAK